jgi:hypothetical protein
VHRCHTCQGHGFALANRVISGLLQTALAMRAGGSFAALRRGVRIYLQERLVVRHGMWPPDRTSREYLQKTALMSLFAPVTGDHGSDNAARSFILLKHLNGDWSTPFTVIHFCPMGCCPGDTAADLARHKSLIIADVVMALLPHTMPIFSRSRWIGEDEANAFAGFLFSVNTVFAEVIPCWVRELSIPSKPITSKDFQLTCTPLTEADMRLKGLELMEGALVSIARGEEEILVPDAAEAPDDQVCSRDSPRVSSLSLPSLPNNLMF